MSGALHAAFLAATLPAMDLVYNLARRLAAAPIEVDDLVQETYLRAYRAWSDGRTPRKVEPWIATICLNTGRSWARRSRQEVPLDDLEPDGARADAPLQNDEVVDAAIAGLERVVVRRALLRLTEEQRIAIALMDLAGFTAAEAAQITGSPRGTILARAHRGRKKLALLLRRSVIVDEEP